MNSSVIGKIIYFWIFILGGLFAARLFGFADDTGFLFKVLILCGIIFAAFVVVFSRAKAKNADSDSSQSRGAAASVSSNRHAGKKGKKR